MDLYRLGDQLVTPTVERARLPFVHAKTICDLRRQAGQDAFLVDDRNAVCYPLSAIVRADCWGVILP